MNAIKQFCASLACLLLILQSASADSPTLTVVDKAGKSVVLKLDDNCLVFGVATWCPHSLELKHLINHPLLKSDLSKARIIFVFENQEWPMVQYQLQQMVEAKQITSDDAADELAELKERAHGSGLFDGSFLIDAGCECYKLPPNSSVKIPGYPSLYSVKTGSFGQMISEAFLKFTTSKNLAAAIDEVYPKN